MKKIIAVSLFALSWAGAAHAESDASAAAPHDAGDTIIVTASRSGDAVPAHLIGSSVTVLDSDALDKRQTRVLSDILRDVPGLAVSRSGAIGNSTQVRIRGSEANHLLLFIDGIKATDPYLGEYDFGGLIADENARVEVLRGPQSALYGSDAIGGVISYTTLSGREAPGVTARAEGGSFGTFSAAGRVAGTAGADFDYALSASYLTADGYPVAPGGSHDVGSDSVGVAARLNWTPASNVKLTAVARYGHARADAADQMMDASSPIVRGYPVQTAVDSPGSWSRNQSVYGLVRAELDLFDDALTTALSGQLADINYDAMSMFGANGWRARRYRGSFENTLRFGNDRARNRVTLAVDAEREEFRAVDPTGYAFTGRNRIDTLGFVVQYDLTVDDRLALGASARIDANDRFGDVSTHRLTGSYLFGTGTRLHAAYGTGVKAPIPGELFAYADGQYIGNPDLRPERSRGWEAGVEQTIVDGGLTLGATWFQSRFSDQIETVGAFIDGNYISTSRNNAEVAKQRGVEAYAHARLGDIRVDAAYTWLKAPQRVLALADPAPEDGSYQPPVPIETQAVRRARTIASLNIGYAPEALPLTATLTVRHNGKQRDYAFNAFWDRLLVDMKAYTLVNLGATFDIGPSLQLFGRVENLLDEDYQEIFAYASPGRAAYGGVRVRF